jgi:hypothetical protein
MSVLKRTPQKTIHAPSSSMDFTNSMSSNGEGGTSCSLDSTCGRDDTAGNGNTQSSVCSGKRHHGSRNANEVRTGSKSFACRNPKPSSSSRVNSAFSRNSWGPVRFDTSCSCSSEACFAVWAFTFLCLLNIFFRIAGGFRMRWRAAANMLRLALSSFWPLGVSVLRLS